MIAVAFVVRWKPARVAHCYVCGEMTERVLYNVLRPLVPLWTAGKKLWLRCRRATAFRLKPIGVEANRAGSQRGR